MASILPLAPWATPFQPDGFVAVLLMSHGPFYLTAFLAVPSARGTCTVYSQDSLPHPLHVSAQVPPLKAAFSETPPLCLIFSR